MVQFSYILNMDNCFLQINSHHSNAVIHVLSGRLTIEKINIVLVQISWPFRGRVRDYGNVRELLHHRNSVAKSYTRLTTSP
jgi:hypothetical protein